jgi:hypothetical protein
MAPEAVGVLAVMACPVRWARSPGLLRLKRSHELASYRALAAIAGSAGCDVASPRNGGRRLARLIDLFKGSFGSPRRSRP